MPRVAPYGSWCSPVSSRLATTSSNSIRESPRVDAVTGNVFWCEQMNNEDGQNAVFHYNPGTREVVRWTPREYDVRTRVHEYGGGDFTVHGGVLFFSHGTDGVLYRQDSPTAPPRPLTTSTKKRYADGVYWPQAGALVVVREDHAAEGEATNTLVRVDASTGAEVVLRATADFYASPTLSPDGTRLAWVEWDHPNMPWMETSVCVGRITDQQQVEVLYTRRNGSSMAPRLTGENELFCIHDGTGWWNLYQVKQLSQETNLTPEQREVGWPMWVFGLQPYDLRPSPEGQQVALISGHELRVLDMTTGKMRRLDTGYSVHQYGVVYSKDGKKVYTVAGDGAREPRLIQVEVEGGGVEVVGSGGVAPVDPSYLSLPRHITFPTTQDDVAYGYLYLPKSQDWEGPPGEHPPLLVKAHGGPTSAASCTLNMEVQFFTTRGFAVLDLNYRGSTGYGTNYRNKLNHMWGVRDVEDVVAAVRYLVSEGQVHPSHLCMDGGSAGGFLTLAALASDAGLGAGASYYGVSDTELLARETHKFESRYMDVMIGELDTHLERYRQRSPIHNHHSLNTPVIFFQGTDDKIVLPNQAEMMYEVVKGKGLPTALVLYQGEAHGFVKPENLRSSLEAEIYFYSQVFGFILGDISCDLVLDNLAAWKATQQQQQQQA